MYWFYCLAKHLDNSLLRKSTCSSYLFKSMVNMKLYSIKTLLLHLAIASSYVAWTSYLFVIEKFPNPIGTGVRQWFCIFLHLTITLFVMLSYLGKATDKRNATLKLVFHVAAIALTVLLLTVFDNPLSEWLWRQR